MAISVTSGKSIPYAEAGQAHRCRSEHRVHRPTREMHICSRRHRYEDYIVYERPEEILMYVLHRPAAQSERCRNITEPAVHENHVCGIYRNVRSRAYRNSYVGSL